MSLLSDRLVSCPHYGRYSFEDRVAAELEIGKAIDPATCSGCGGCPRLGPSCWCPVHGESDDDE